MKKCPNCGACQKCGHVPAPWTPWWGVVPPYRMPYATPSYPQPTTTSNPYKTFITNTTGGLYQ